MSRFAHLLVSSLLVASVVGCAIPFEDAGSRGAVNVCSSNGDCSSDAVCREGLCLATQIDIEGLLLEVKPNSGASFGPSTSFLLAPGDPVRLQGTDDNGFATRFDASLPPLVSITSGKVHLTYASDCTADKSFPATIELSRVVSRFVGFPAKTYTAHAEKKKDGAGTYEFNVDVPPGYYDVYIQPRAIEDCIENPPPPILYRDQKIDSDGTLDWGVVKATRLQGDIQVPDGGSLLGWYLDIVEPDGGRVVSSTQQVLQSPLDSSVNVDLEFIWMDPQLSPYIRLRPPEGVEKPSVYWGLWEALINSTPMKPEVHLTVENLLVEPRIVEAQVQDEDHLGVVAAVRIQSVKLSGEVATNAAYSIDVPETDINGFFKVLLPPGNYRIRATPAFDDTVAVVDDDLDVPALEDPTAKGADEECFCGHVVTVPKKTRLGGSVSTPTGQPLIGSSILTAPSQTSFTSYWNVVHALDPLLPRPASGLSDTFGDFTLHVDRGASDVSVRPGEQSGFPWLVRSRLTVQLADAVIDLPALAVPNPAILTGTLTDPSGQPIANADLDAWLPVRDPNAEDGLAGTVIQIAATSTDAYGRYTLILPASISQ